MRNREVINPHGHLEIYKLYNDGREELHFSDHNVITSGMGLGFAYLFSASASLSITDYQIRWFQVGTSSLSSYGTSTYQLGSSIADSSLYGSIPDIIVDTHDQYANGTIINNVPFARIPFNNTFRASKTSVRYSLYLGRDSGNDIGVPINEVGLFMHNPMNRSPVASVLVAYRTFTNILKTDEFALLFKWTISF